MAMNKTIIVKGTEITIIRYQETDYISLTDMVRPFGDESIITNWLRNRNTIEFLGIWEQIYNPDFKPLEFEGFKKQAGLNSFWISPKKWIDTTNAIGLISKAGRYGGGTYAHKDIAFEFGSWLSPEFKLYLIKEFQRLKDEENDRLKLEWNLQRTLSKINYRIHTDAIKEKLIPPAITKQQSSIIYASEADVLNMALFGQTAAEWRNQNKNKKGLPAEALAQAGNIRDEATLEQLVVLTNLEGINAVFIKQGLPQPERLQKLNEIAISQMKSLLNSTGIKKLK
jgi:KilA-N domain